ncbi:MAG: phospholipase [Candidatus Omnitrophica bacterium]|nr:phospholipase [Candidatus Omnitrophota bacterium]
MNEQSHDETNPILHRSVEVPIAGHFLVRPPIDGGDRALILGFHGYAENAETHLERLLMIPGAEKDWLVSVQALHPFYRTRTGEVVASWMTKFHREEAIRENREYVDRVLDRLRKDAPKETPLVLTGFSQGVAMAYRACLSERHPPAALIVLGADFPPDLAERSDLNLPPILLGRGNVDKLYPPEQFQKDLRALEAKGAKVTLCEFEGGHEWNKEFAQRVGDFLHGTNNGN